MRQWDRDSVRWWVTTGVFTVGLSVLLTFVGLLVAAELEDHFGGPAFLVAILGAPGHVSKMVTGGYLHATLFLPSFLGTGVVMWSVIALPVVMRLRRWVSEP